MHPNSYQTPSYVPCLTAHPSINRENKLLNKCDDSLRSRQIRTPTLLSYKRLRINYFFSDLISGSESEKGERRDNGISAAKSAEMFQRTAIILLTLKLLLYYDAIRGSSRNSIISTIINTYRRLRLEVRLQLKPEKRKQEREKKRRERIGVRRNLHNFNLYTRMKSLNSLPLLI